MSLATMVHEAFVAFTTRHREELDAWAVVEKASIAESAEHHRRAIAQRVRQARIRLIVEHGDFPAWGDPDFLPIVQAIRNRSLARRLRGMSTRSTLDDIQLTLLESQLRFAAGLTS